METARVVPAPITINTQTLNLLETKRTLVVINTSLDENNAV
ncbi:MAG: hypothetical protein NTV80_07135 [Verrucomicrobia bacterium]|nr:hypothetical protein [Verrucomicrobiota bacterium]